MKKNKVQCLDCGLYESEEWAESGKHICNVITDPSYPSEWLFEKVVRIGKRRFVAFIK